MGVQYERPLDELIEAFQEHLRRTRGTDPPERQKKARYVRMFVEHVTEDDPVDVLGFAAPDVIGFIVSLLDRYRPNTIRHVSTALRGFFRFLRMEGIREDRLDDAVPGVVHRRHLGLPRHIDGVELDRFIDSLDRSTPCAQRNRAMILCVARLGLRASEVVRIRLEDIDWRASVLHVPTRKTGRGALLPLVADVGDAIAEYVKDGRPATSCRHVFVLHQAVRVGEPARPQVVSDVVRDAMEKARVESPTLGPNVLRHTLATRLVRSGAPLKEIADLLGHRRLETTQIYAKLDLESLRGVAQPWPEVVS